jgi:hypothetical protein
VEETSAVVTEVLAADRVSVVVAVFAEAGAEI